jgi:hypothetical protein
MDWREWFWWPSIKMQAVAGAVMLSAITLLGIMGVPRILPLAEFAAVKGSTAWHAAVAVIVVALNFVLFLVVARPDYLAFRNGIRPISRSFLLLSAAFLVIWAISRMVANAMPPSSALSLPWTSFARAVFVSQAGFTMALLFSAIWKPASQDTLEAMQMLGSIQSFLHRLFRERPMKPFQPSAAKELQDLLKAFVEKLEKLKPRPFIKADRDYAEKLEHDSDILVESLQIPEVTFAELRCSSDQALHAAVRSLLGEEKDG